MTVGNREIAAEDFFIGFLESESIRNRYPTPTVQTFTISIILGKFEPA
jgi:hypothetical protein